MCTKFVCQNWGTLEAPVERSNLLGINHEFSSLDYLLIWMSLLLAWFLWVDDFFKF
jgi:hypothetical protein